MGFDHTLILLLEGYLIRFHVVGLDEVVLLLLLQKGRNNEVKKIDLVLDYLQKILLKVAAQLNYLLLE